MNINFNKKLLFFHIPKCAGKSIMSSFGIEKNRIIDRSVVCGLSHTVVVNDFAKHYENQSDDIINLFQSFIKFTIVRNPYDRLVSLYHYRKKENDLYNLYVGANENGGDDTTPEGTKLSFKEWVMDDRSRAVGNFWTQDPFLRVKSHVWTSKEKQIHLFANHQNQYHATIEWISQINFITNHKGDVLVDDILRFENLDEEIKNFCKKYNLNEVVLPKKNSSVRKKNYVGYYDDELIEFATRLFEDDLEHFNYKFGD